MPKLRVLLGDGETWHSAVDLNTRRITISTDRLVLIEGRGDTDAGAAWRTAAQASKPVPIRIEIVYSTGKKILTGRFLVRLNWRGRGVGVSLRSDAPVDDAWEPLGA